MICQICLGSVGHVHRAARVDYNGSEVAQFRLQVAAGCSTASETFTYDDDGNMTKDGLRVLDEYNQPILDTERVFSWDAENRLWFAAPKHPQAGSIGWWYKYDQLGRRVRKYSTLWDPTFNSGQGGWQIVPIWPPVEDYRYVYDGWNLVLELDATSWGGAGVPPVKRKYTWGLDLSGTLQGAGGIGGLLAVEDHSGGTGVPPVSRLYFYDANGNVGQLVDSTDGTVVAKYECDPYGNVLLDPANASQSGSYAAGNPFRFSTKYLDAETGFPYFGYRYLDPPVGRWTSRDPIGDAGGTNLFAFVRNEASTRVDPLGTCPIFQQDNLVWQIVMSPCKLYFGSSWFGHRELCATVDVTAIVVRARNLRNPCCSQVGIVQIAHESKNHGAFSNWLLDLVGSSTPPFYAHANPYPYATARFLSFGDDPGWDPFGSYNGKEYDAEFESCIVCVHNSAKVGCTLGCIRWGFNYRWKSNTNSHIINMWTVTESLVSGAPIESPLSPILSKRPRNLPATGTFSTLIAPYQ